MIIKPKVSVIIATKDRPQMIKQCVEAILNNTFKEIELLVIDQSKENNTQCIIEEIAKNDQRIYYFKYDLYKLYTTKKHIPRSVSLARNYGASKASSDILLFTDDDCIADNMWIENTYSFFKNNSSAACVMGSVLKAPHDMKNGTIPGFEHPPKCTINTVKDLLSTEYPLGMGANFAIQKSIFKEFNGFDETLINSEDWDLFFRLLFKKYTLMVNPEIIVTHYGFRNWQDLIRLAEEYTYTTTQSLIGHFIKGEREAVIIWMRYIKGLMQFVLKYHKAVTFDIIVLYCMHMCGAIIKGIYMGITQKGIRKK